MKTGMRKWMLLALLLLSGCGAAQLKDASTIKTVDQLEIKLQDQRSEDEKKTIKGSVLLTACTYGIYQYGDDRLSPDAATYFANYVNNHFTSDKSQDTLVLHRLQVFYNAQAGLRGDVDPALLATAIVKGVSCYPNIDTPGAVDHQTEAPNGAAAMIVYVDADFRGHHYVTRYVELVKRLTQFQVMYSVLDHAFDATFKTTQ